ncbi:MULTISPECIES: hypothetical protein [unclassified Pseudoalteromonas]|uniref:hypothetical protein n=1 Tax=unclassified Pseudoalteromonas TaxID=194690 RepID=UPI001C77D29A|nr:hypothetical protein [Pseudoalteromonas sp.]MCP4585066.1 hypothetical protein [Pseudoalteromonas sp.]QWV05949.1 hypothetical protein KQ246_05780 [Pseudoalteromonas shioyasakiensis]
MFSTLMKRVALSSLLTCSAMAVADQSDYKLMVIDQSITANVAENRQYEQAFNDCALSVKDKKFSEAETLCSKAISLLSTSKVPSHKRRELTSFTLSNRGVARIMSENDTAALSDFYEAVQISGNELVEHNLTRAKKNLAL